MFVEIVRATKGEQKQQKLAQYESIYQRAPCITKHIFSTPHTLLTIIKEEKLGKNILNYCRFR